MTTLGTLALASIAALAAIWAGYPLVIAALAAIRVRENVQPTNGCYPRVSVVIATREAAEAVVVRVLDLMRTDYPHDRIEIIVARDVGSAGIRLTGTHDVPLRCVEADSPGGKAAALNAAVRCASGDILVFADTYQKYEPATIACLVAPFERQKIGAVTGNYRLPESGRTLVGLYWRFESWLRRNEAVLHSPIGATGAVWAMRRSLWQPLRPGLILDDVWTPMRIGLSRYRVAVSSCAVALETRRSRPEREYKRKVRTLTGVIQLCAWMPAILSPIRNPLWMQFVFHKLLRMLSPYLLIAPGLWLAASILVGVESTTRVSVLAALLISSLWVAFGRDRVSGRMRRMISEGVLLQLAVIIAGYNGLRGNWRVWD
jgi:cellulose synthase/poly-beta-1,6-N-acetylglucosamine synthase-like glycosyltransferase